MSQTATETSLIERLQRGDSAAFEAIVEAHQSVIYGYLRARVVQPADAEDLAQEVFLRFYAGRRNFDAGQPIRPWLLGIARNSLREFVRLHRRRKEVGWTAICLELDENLCKVKREGIDGPLDDAMQQLPDCLGALGESAREALTLRYNAKMRLAQIGQKLHRSEGAIKLLMFRARQALKNCLGRAHGDTSHGDGSHGDYPSGDGESPAACG